MLTATIGYESLAYDFVPLLESFNSIMSRAPEPDRKVLWDKFKVAKANPQGNIFDNVTRFLLKSSSGTELLLDINTSIYPVDEGETFVCQVSRRLNERQVYSPDELAQVSDNDFEYIMSGLVFRMDSVDDHLNVYASFGGLMMKMTGDYSQLENFKTEGLEVRILFMMKRI